MCHRRIRRTRLRGQLDRALARSVRRKRTTTHVDLEGEVVWLQAYARERARGAREQDARATVLAALTPPRRAERARAARIGVVESTVRTQRWLPPQRRGRRRVTAGVAQPVRAGVS